jgi:hypothetical protein
MIGVGCVWCPQTFNGTHAMAAKQLASKHRRQDFQRQKLADAVEKVFCMAANWTSSAHARNLVPLSIGFLDFESRKAEI